MRLAGTSWGDIALPQSPDPLAAIMRMGETGMGKKGLGIWREMGKGAARNENGVGRNGKASEGREGTDEMGRGGKGRGRRK